ncbi:hypothetical protein DPMN_093552 [Dreissena polymorpha]|uniref:Uncharacterized protein n=1 Tax=Dreissena polymorpha TaxID=45954 RepID=A0A9D4L4D7_DREPO|nr:hypothetical protein DPMN_093552 [Dreissena polymorpha]
MCVSSVVVTSTSHLGDPGAIPAPGSIRDCSVSPRIPKTTSKIKIFPNNLKAEYFRYNSKCVPTCVSLLGHTPVPHIVQSQARKDLNNFAIHKLVLLADKCFTLCRDITGTNVLTYFHEYWQYIGFSVFTSFFYNMTQ